MPSISPVSSFSSSSSSRITWEPIDQPELDSPGPISGTSSTVADGFDEPDEEDVTSDLEGLEGTPAGSTIPGPSVSLVRNAQGPEVVALQQALAAKGYYTGTADGKFGAGTEEAVRRFQVASGLSPDGKAGRLTLAALGLAGTAGTTGTSGGVSVSGVITGTQSRGSLGPSVALVQEALRAKGLYSGKSDGNFGSGTEEAVKRFQAANGLTADGKAGRATIQALGLRFIDAVAEVNEGPGGSNVVVARLSRYPNGTGMVTGTITVNGHSYAFNSGKGNKRCTPRGTFTVTRHQDSRSDRGFVRNGVGFSFRVQDGVHGFDTSTDSRDPRGYRTVVRIHPDGGSNGTSGCIGLSGSAAELRRFREDMNAVLRANGGSVKIKVV